ncbi:hypothetical protein HM1_2254 [Heliomicrobium modesticaldum Ice1]|uniref:Uncharacterized protein n=1 Tax=Heliobacterium modesticaldum (strain ATCC 51547 / Ice1) TaxID=498761 RepID=B0THD5_HELMI|nr:hypothetical protein [Heliomicrobium modesticaldum]ABZ84810.1 hypothetical protein HM1_2254 [Heliomicrobium modesticaldum Ice1]
MDSGTLLTGIGCLLMGAGLTSSFLQRQNQRDKIEQETLRRQLAEARLVKRDMETLLATAMETGDEVVDQLKIKVEEARRLLERLETLSTLADGRAETDRSLLQTEAPSPGTETTSMETKNRFLPTEVRSLRDNRGCDASQQKESPTRREVVLPEASVAEKVKPLRPVYIREYLQHQGARAATSSSLISGAETLLKSLAEGEPRQWSKSQRYDLIPQLRQIGLHDGEIAQLLHLGKGEVQLVSELRRRA